MCYRNASYGETTFDRYFFEKDLFGNIVAVYNEAGTKVANYCYDAWGNCTVMSNTNGIGTMNPFRYRGYYLDTETNLYYLQTRYYDSYVGRFINEDNQIYCGFVGSNLFAYCTNNPVMYVDYAGTNAEEALLSWMIGASWLPFADGVLPIGDLIYLGGIVLIGITVLSIPGDSQVSNDVKTDDNPRVDNPQPDTSNSKNHKDDRLKGNPGAINRNGYKETKIGPDGRAEWERHWTDHGNPRIHSNPHDHKITWTPDGHPSFEPPINHFGGSLIIFK